MPEIGKYILTVNSLIHYYRSFLIGIFVILIIYLSSLHNYLLFHSLSELFSTIIATGIFVVAWNSRRFTKNNYLLFIGMSFLFVGILDIFHILTYKGMGVFPGYSANTPTQLWISFRYLQAISFLLAPLFIKRKLNVKLVFFTYFAFTSLILTSIFIWKNFPTAYVEGVGLTQFKIISEYIISLIFSASVFLIWINRKSFERKILIIISIAILFSIGSEIFFTTYVSVYGFSNMLGHVFEIISFYLFYVAIIETGLSKPYDLLFLGLKQKENQIEKEKDRLGEYLNAVNAIYLAIDTSKKIVMVNTKGSEILGYEKKDIIGKKWLRFIPKSEWSRTNNLFKKIIKGKIKSAEYIEQLMYVKNGVRRIAWRNSVVKNSRGHVVYVLISGEDITESKKTELNLKETQRNYTKLFQNKLTGMSFCKVILNKNNKPVDYTYLDVNQTFEDIIGLDREKIIGKRFTDIFPSMENSDFNFINTFAKVSLTGEEKIFEAYHQQLQKWLSIQAYSPKKGYFIAVSRDITRRKKLEQRKNEFISVASHELKTPVASLGIYSQLLVKRLSTTEDKRSLHIASSVLQQTNRLAQLIDDLLDVGRIEDGKLKLDKKEFNLDELVKKTVINFQYSVNTHEFLREGEPGKKVFGDEIRIGQVLSNLINNAVKYSPEKTKIIIRSKTNTDHVIISVKDSGFGISKSDKLKIFNRLYRTEESEKSKSAGFGFGLYIASEIIKKHGGQMWVESRKHKGSEFFFTLPYKSLN